MVGVSESTMRLLPVTFSSSFLRKAKGLRLLCDLRRSLQFLETLGKTRIANFARSHKSRRHMDIVHLQEKSSSGGCLGTNRGCNIDAPGDDVSQGQYFVEAQESQPINLLFAALFDLIIYRTTKVGLFIPSAGEGCDLDAIFAENVPHVKDDLKYLIYSAAFNLASRTQLRSRADRSMFTEAVYRVLQRLAQNVSHQWRSYQQKDEEAAGVLVCPASAEQQVFLTKGRRQ